MSIVGETGAYAKSIGYLMIVTFKFENSMYDLQVPSDIPTGDLLVWVLEYVNQLAFKRLQPNHVALLLNRRNVIIRPELTFDEAGVWNGDYITIICMG